MSAEISCGRILIFYGGCDSVEQCHIGLDTLSWARRGAVVSGLDFSAPAINAASAIADSVGIDASFAISDVYDAAVAFSGQRFDIVYTGAGALIWLPDIQLWAQVVASLLASGGFLYLVEGHPLATILDDDSGSAVAGDYFDSSPRVEDFLHTYTGGPIVEHARIVRFRHSLGAIITALAEAGLRIDFVHEYDFDTWQRFSVLERSPDGNYRFPAGSIRIPLLFSLRASSPS